MFEIPVASEVTNLVNFLTLDLLLLPFVMHVSGLLAGYANHAALCKGGRLRLVVFDIPLVGGGIVMSRCWQRTFFILLRLSVVAAVALCNFGLEGRSRTAFVTRESTVRVPGALHNSFKTIYSATERRMRCSDSMENGDFKFGAVVEDRCYLNVTDHVYIPQVAFNVSNITVSASNCKPSIRCNAVTTTYHCDELDMVCGGTPNDSGCLIARGVELRSCVAVVYATSEDIGWLCLDGWVMPGNTSEPVMCRGFHAKRQHIKDWVRYYIWATKDPLVAIFGSAYGTEARRNVTLPEGERFVTVVRASWLVPLLWVVTVALGLTIWWVLQCMVGSHVIVHDERGLTKLLNKTIDGNMSDVWSSEHSQTEHSQDVSLEHAQDVLFMQNGKTRDFWLNDPERAVSEEGFV